MNNIISMEEFKIKRGDNQHSNKEQRKAYKGTHMALAEEQGKIVPFFGSECAVRKGLAKTAYQQGLHKLAEEILKGE